MSLSPLEYLRHVLDEADYLAVEVARLTRERFLSDETAKRAFVRSIEIVGEAIKKVPDNLRTKYPDIKWRAMAAMRDKMVHNYFGIDYEIVWDVVVNKIPVVRTQVAELLRKEGKPA